MNNQEIEAIEILITYAEEQMKDLNTSTTTLKHNEPNPEATIEEIATFMRNSPLSYSWTELAEKILKQFDVRKR